MSARKLGRRVWRAAIMPVVLIGCATALAAQRQVTKAQATAVADSLNLRHGDLPGFTQIGRQMPPSAAAQKVNAAFAACYGGPPYSGVYADTQSPTFQGSAAPATVVVSETEIFPSAALAARDIASAAGALGRACALAFGRATLSPPKGTKIIDTLTPIASRVSGTGAAIAVRLALIQVPTSTGGPARKVVATEDEFSFVRGQAEIGLDVGTASGAAPSASLERRLASLVAARLRSVMG